MGRIDLGILGTDGNVGGPSGSPLPPWDTGINVMHPTYGAKGDGVTDDTAAVQGAINAASAKASSNQVVDVWLPPGYGFLLSQLTAKNNTRIWAYGSTIIPNVSGLTNGLLSTNASNLSRFEIRGGNWTGTGTETGFQTVFEKYGGGTTMTDCVFADMYITNWGTGPLYCFNPTRVCVRNNTILNPGDGGSGLNAINFPAGGTAAHSDILCYGNIVEGALAAAIDYANTQTSGSGAIRVVIANNLCSGSTTNGHNPTCSGSIQLEFDEVTGGPWTDFIVANNIVNNPNITAGAYGILVGVAGATIQKATVHGNRVKATAYGIYAGNVGQDLQISGNRIDAPTPLHLTNGQTYNGSGNQFSTGPSQGRATLVAGTVTVSTAEVVANDNVILSRVVTGGTTGQLSVGTITAGTSFVINSSSATDTSTVYWRIDH